MTGAEEILIWVARIGCGLTVLIILASLIIPSRGGSD